MSNERDTNVCTGQQPAEASTTPVLDALRMHITQLEAGIRDMRDMLRNKDTEIHTLKEQVRIIKLFEKLVNKDEFSDQNKYMSQADHYVQEMFARTTVATQLLDNEALSEVHKSVSEKSLQRRGLNEEEEAQPQ